MRIRPAEGCAEVLLLASDQPDRLQPFGTEQRRSDGFRQGREVSGMTLTDGCNLSALLQLLRTVFADGFQHGEAQTLGRVRDADQRTVAQLGMPLQRFSPFHLAD